MNKNKFALRHFRSFNLKPLTAIIIGILALQAQAADTLTMLGDLNAGNPYSSPSALSGDGGTVVGYSLNSINNPEAFRWTAGSGMVGLGFLGTGTNSYASAVSADGGTVVRW